MTLKKSDMLAVEDTGYFMGSLRREDGKPSRGGGKRQGSLTGCESVNVPDARDWWYGDQTSSVGKDGLNTPLQ